MKSANCIWIFLLSLATTLAGQNDMPEWRIGVGGGFNVHKLQKGTGIGGFNWILVAEQESADVELIGNRIGGQLNLSVQNYLNRSWRFRTGMGLSYAHSKAYRETRVETSFFGMTANTVAHDTVDQEYLILDLPFILSWHLISSNRPASKVHLFLDAGLSFEFALINNSTFHRRENESNLKTGKVTLTQPVPYFGFGFEMEDRYQLSIGSSFYRDTKIDGQDYNYNSVLTRFTFTYLF